MGCEHDNGTIKTPAPRSRDWRGGAEGSAIELREALLRKFTDLAERLLKVREALEQEYRRERMEPQEALSLMRRETSERCSEFSEWLTERLMESAERMLQEDLRREAFERPEERRDKPRVASWWIRFRLHLDGLDRYHGAAALVLTTGSVGMFLASYLALAPLWAGFLAGALPTFLLAVLVYPEHA